MKSTFQARAICPAIALIEECKSRGSFRLPRCAQCMGLATCDVCIEFSRRRSLFQSLWLADGAAEGLGILAAFVCFASS